MKELDNNTIDVILQQPAFWCETGPYQDVVLSSNIRVVRNIYSVSFPRRQDENEADYITQIGRQFAGESALAENSLFLSLDELTYSNRRLLKERDIITDDSNSNLRQSVIAGADCEYIIILNNEDHFNIVVNRPGLQIDEAYKTADRIDDELNRYAVYAYSENLGYVTSNPLKLGTGLTVSTILHLPVISLNKKIYAVFEAAGKNGLILSGADGEDRKVNGSIYRLSNRDSIGITESDIIKLVEEATHKIIEIECTERDIYQLEYQNQLEDKIFRSYGLLKYARSIDYPEALNCLSDLRLGIITSLIKDYSLPEINGLIINCRGSHLQKIAGRIFTDDSECNIFRASYLRDQLERSTIYG